MKKYLSILVLSLFACDGAGSTLIQPGPQRDCEADNAACEWAAHRSSSNFSFWFAARDCSWDYGVCIGKLGETECEDWCGNVTYVPSECVYGCQAYNSTEMSNGM